MEWSPRSPQGIERAQLDQQTLATEALGAQADAAWISGNGTVIGLLKKVVAVSGGGGGGGAVTVADGADIAQGTIADTAWTGTGTSTVIAALKAIYAKVAGTITVSGTFWQATQPVSAASLPLPTGAATSANQPTAAAQASTTSGQTGLLLQAAAATSAPSYTNGQTNPLSLALDGSLRVNGNPGSANIATAQVSVANTSTSLAGARTGRNAITVMNHGTAAVYLGASGVSTSTGILLPGISGASVTVPFTGALYGVVASGTQTVSVLETY